VIGTRVPQLTAHARDHTSQKPRCPAAFRLGTIEDSYIQDLYKIASPPYLDVLTYRTPLAAGSSHGMLHMFRTRFREQIVAEFLPPSRARKVQKVVILCDGMPSIPSKQPLMEFLSRNGYWVIYPRYRGAWESAGQFLEKSPHEDILDIIADLPKEIEEIAFGRRFRLLPDQFLRHRRQLWRCGSDSCIA